LNDSTRSPSISMSGDAKETSETMTTRLRTLVPSNTTSSQMIEIGTAFSTFGVHFPSHSLLSSSRFTSSSCIRRCLSVSRNQYSAPVGVKYGVMSISISLSMTCDDSQVSSSMPGFRERAYFHEWDLHGKKPTIISSLRFGKCRGSMDAMEDPG